MDRHTVAEVLALMTLSEFRQFKRALAVLHRSHVLTADAIDLLVSAHVRRTRFTHQNREMDRAV
jgi:hypothetical protein